ncbi:MAG: T9SS type A sorting domain-containing protein [Bacteroidales bacterium]|nr:T9SS type A sorting domain-containing protein [Bacteroidales bacterium]
MVVRPWAVASSGGEVLSPDGTTISYTVGQSSYRHFGSNPLMQEGVQQAFCIPTLDTVHYEICQGVADTFLSLLPVGFVLPSSVRLDVAGVYPFVMSLLAEGGCDSIIYGVLTVHPDRDTQLFVQESECYNWFGQDYSSTGVYTHHVPTVHGCDSLLTLNLSVIKDRPLPVIWGFNDEVLFVQHAYDGYNEIHYADYRWYRDGVLVKQDTAADRFFNEGGGKLSGCFYLEVPTDTSKTVWVRSNTICLSNVGIDEAQEMITLTLYPNPVGRHQVVHVSLSLSESQLAGASVKVYDAQGRQVMQRAAFPQTDLVCDFAAGVYSVHVVLGDGRHAARKLVVR